MTIPSIIYASYQPAEIRVDNLGIALSQYTNDTLNLTPTQYLIVGEKQYGKYSFIVDATGIAVNTTLPIRTDTASQYAAYIDGDVFVTGNVFTNGGLVYSGSSNSAGGSGSVGVGAGAGANYVSPWLQSDTYNNIWFPGTVTMGNYFDSSNNPYTLNIVQSADRTIDHSQLSIQNTEYAQMRLGIVGTSIASPAIINTPPGTNLEFHIGRDQSYFQLLYTACNYISVNNADGTTSNIMQTTPDDIPHYEYYNTTKKLSPHIIIDTAGNIGIHTSSNIQLNYNILAPNPSIPQNIIYSPVAESMALHVEGSTYTSNLLIFDYQTGMPKNLDELYIRRLGVTIPAGQVDPGTFANGDYNFASNVNLLNGNIYVNGSEHIIDNLAVDGTSSLNQIIANDAILVDVASFCNDVYINRDIIINQSLRIRGQIFTEMLKNIDSVDGVPRSNYEWQMIDFMPSSPLLSNINFVANGFWTPGRVGIGTNNGFNNQLSVFKYDTNMYELELHNSDPSLTYSAGAFIGHPQVDTNMQPDGSLVIATPSIRDVDYVGQHPSGVPQNIYFFPGTDMGSIVVPVVRQDNPPTLGIFYNKYVSIGTYYPVSELDVRGSITFSSNLQYYDQSVSPPVITNLGLWKSKIFQNINPNTNTGVIFKGIQFSDAESKNVAINYNPEQNYALVVGDGAIKSYDGYYTKDDRVIVPWISSVDRLSLCNYVAPPVQSRFGLSTYGNVGMGVPVPTATLELKGNYSDSTTIRLYQGDNSTSPTTAIEFSANDIWRIQANNTKQTLEFGYGVNTFTSDNNPRALWMKGNQVVIGDNMKALDLTTNNLDPYAALNVGGNLAVKGDVNITGGFKINSQPYQNEIVSVTGTQIPINNDDVFIGGGNIVLTPAVGKTLVIGKPGPTGGELNSSADNALFRVYQDYNAVTPFVGVFHSTLSTGLLKIISQTGQSLLFGVMDQSTTLYGGDGQNTIFSFMDGNYSPYISFNSTATSERYVGLNTNTPNSLLHIYTQNTGSNMLRLTKYVYGQDSSSSCPEMYLEKIYSQSGLYQQLPTRWTIKGPNAAYGQKLSFIYDDNVNVANELFCFTNNGCIGIGTSQPKFSLDIANTGSRGSLRLLNTDSASSPQLLFESGNGIYGDNPTYDFRMVASNSQFTFDMQNNATADIIILNVGNQGNVTFKGQADPLYEVTVTGSLNVTQGIYLNGAKLFGTGGSSSLDQGIPLSAANIFLEPYISYGGGVVINGSTPTGNLFHIYNGANANFVVFDSLDTTSPYTGQIQLHFRNTIRTFNYATSQYVTHQNMYRMSMVNTQFQWEYWPNCTSATLIGSEHTYYKQVLQFGPSLINADDFDTSFNGSLTLNSTSANIFFGSGAGLGTHVYNGVISGSNANLIINPARGLGIGTYAPNSNAYFTHIYNNSNVRALHIDHYTQADVFSINTCNINRITVSTSGNVGIGTSRPRSQIDVIGQIYTTAGTSFKPSYTFSSDSTTGIYMPTVNTLGFSAAGVNVINVTPQLATINTNMQILGNNAYSIPSLSIVQQYSVNNTNIVEIGTQSAKDFIVNYQGYVGIGTTVVQYPLHVNGNVGIGGNLYPTSNLAYNIGSPTQRWHDIYLSGTTIDLNNTKIGQIPADGSIILYDTNGLQKIVAGGLQIGNSNTTGIIQMQLGSDNTVQFTTIDNVTGQSTTFTPLYLGGTNNSLSVGTGAGDASATLHVIDTSNVPVAILDQASTGDLLQLYSHGNRVLTVNEIGYMGIGTGPGTSAPSGPLVINTSSYSNIAYIQQNNSAGNVATFVAANSSNVVINNYGYVGIGTSSPVVPLHVEGSQFYDGFANFNKGVYINGNLEVYGDAIAHGNQVVDSDVRLKDNVKKIDGALDKLKQLTGYTFTMKNNGKKSTGLIAQEVIRVLPEAVNTDNEYLGLAYGNLMGLVIESIKELSNSLDEVKKKLDI